MSGLHHETAMLDRKEQLSRMKLLFAQWDEEDRLLNDEEAEVLQKALEENRGLAFRTSHFEYIQKILNHSPQIPTSYLFDTGPFGLLAHNSSLPNPRDCIDYRRFASRYLGTR